MGTKSTLATLALLAGCSYDYGILGYDGLPEAAAPATGGEPSADGAASEGPLVMYPTLPPGEEGSVADTVAEEVADGEETDAGTGEDTGAPVAGGGSTGDTGWTPPADTATDPLPPEDTGLIPPDTGSGDEPSPTPPDDPPAPPDDPPLDPPSDPPAEPPAHEPEACSMHLPGGWDVQSFPGGRESMVSHVGDIDGDGFPDAAWVNQLDNNVRILWGASGGADPFDPSGWSTLSIGRSEGYISWGDWDGDGWDDIVASNQDAGGLKLLGGMGGRSWRAPVDITTGAFPQRVLFHDSDGDGLLDVLVGDGHSGGTFIVRGIPGGRFDAPAPFVPGSGQLRAADLDGDGWDELLQSRSGSIWLGRGGAYSQASLPFDDAEWLVGGVWPVDLDGDGDPDAVAHGSIGGVEVLLAWQNVGGVLTRCGASAPIPAGLYPTGLGDLGGDGVLDITSQTTCGRCGSTYFIASGTP